MKPSTVAGVIELLRSLPPGTSMSADAVAAWLEPLTEASAPGSSQKATEVQADLTVQQVADAFHRGSSTVRTWLGEGRFPNAYRLLGREWRIPPADVLALQRDEAERFRAAATARKPHGPTASDTEPDLGSWRQHRQRA